MGTAVDVIIIGRNEGLILEKCIISALDSKSFFESKTGKTAAVIYVDSQSCDNSKEIAKRHGLVIYDSPKKYYTCSNARNTGLLLTSSDLVMFLDGDMELKKNWLYDGFVFLKEHPLVAGVSGLRDDYRMQGNKLEEIKNYFNQKNEIELVTKDLGGAVLYRRKALEEIGGFEPAIAPEEDYVLFSQLSQKGWGFFRINREMISHWDMKVSSVNGVIKHIILRPNATISGVIFRHAILHEKWGLTYLFAFKFDLLVHFIILLSFTVFIVMKIYILAISLTILYFIYTIYQKRGIKRGLAAPFTKTIYLVNMIVGFIFNRPKVDFGIQNSLEYRNLIFEINEKYKKVS